MLFFWKYITPLNVLRCISLFFGLSVILFFNFNWIFNKPVNGWSFILSLILSIAIMRFGGVFEVDKNKNKKDFWLFLLLGTFLLLFCFAYFDGNVDEPKYTTEDAATHYLYMSQSSQTGYALNFLPNRAYIDSGNNESYQTVGLYPSGASVPFSLLYNVFPTRNSTSSLQIFNSVFFAFSVLYAFFLLKESRILRFRISLIFMAIIIGCGTFFNLVPASFSTQSFGLLLLLFFFDTYQGFSEGKMSFYIPAIALGSIVFSYIFWFPVATFFLFVYFISNHNFYRPIYVFFTSVLLSFGYVKVLVSLHMLSYASTEGYFGFTKIFLSDIALILPFAILGFIGSIRDVVRNKNVFIGAFLLSSVSYTLVLFVGFHFHLVSEYTAFKSLLLTLPIVWLASFIQIEQVYQKRKMIKNEILRMYIRGIDFSKKDISILSCILFSLMVPLIYSWSTRVPIGIFPLVRNNLYLIFSSSRILRNITVEQLIFLDTIQRDYSWTIDKKRLLVIAPFDTSLWVYAYSGIWPRTLSLLGDEKNVGDYSPMNFYSKGIANYAVWLKNDTSHILVLFDNEWSEEWKIKNDFRLDDYEILFSTGKNYLLRLKK